MIPFEKKVYFKVLAVVLFLVCLAFAIAIKFFNYELTNADPFGAPIASILAAYIIHLVIWNPLKD